MSFRYLNSWNMCCWALLNSKPTHHEIYWAWMQSRNLCLRISLVNGGGGAISTLSKNVDQDFGTTIIHYNRLMPNGPYEGSLLTTSSIIPNTCPFWISEHPRGALARPCNLWKVTWVMSGESRRFQLILLVQSKYCVPWMIILSIVQVCGWREQLKELS